VEAVAAVIPVACVVLEFSLLTGFITESLRLTTRFLLGLIVYLSGDFESPTFYTPPWLPLVWALR